MRRKIPSLQALACFEAAARHESYTRAAQELALTQGAVSRQITALETFLGLVLFRRTRHGVALTERGREYALQIAPRLQALEQDTLQIMSSPPHGSSLHLAAVPTFATRWLIPRLPALKRQYPDLTLHIDTRTRAFMFAETPFEAAIFAGTAEQVRNWAGTQATRLLSEAVVPVCRPQWLAGQTHLEPATLATLPLLQQSTRPHAWQQWFAAVGVVANTNVGSGPRYELFSMAIAAAVSGLGVALVPRLLIEAELLRNELVVAYDACLPSDRAYYLITPEHREPSAALQQFKSWLGMLHNRS